MSALPTLTADAIASIASNLTITDFVTGARIPWVPSRAQREAWAASERSQRVFIGKPRRAYISTGFDLEDALQTVVADTAGHRIRTGVMLDVEAKVTERMWQMVDLLRQMGVEHNGNSFGLELPGGSQIVGLTAGGKRSAASTGFQRMRYSEFSYYTDPQAMISTSSSVGIEGHEVIETTVDIGAANGLQARNYWRDTTNGYEKLFIPFEWLDAYKTDPDRITDEQWAFAQTHGFVDSPPYSRTGGRASAAYWLAELLPAKAGGDLVMLMHEFPQLPEHMFQSSSGRWVRATPKVLEPVDTLRVLGHAGDTHVILIYEKPENTSGDHIITVDTATGKNLDRSTNIVTDRHSKRAVAVLVSGTIMADDLAKCAHALWAHYTRPWVHADGSHRLNRPRVKIESNGVGYATCLAAQRLGLPYDEIVMDEETKYRCLAEAKRAVEFGTFEGPRELAEECDELHRDEHGRWVGKKDLLMTYGMAAVDIAQAPPVVGPAKPRESEKRIDGMKRIRALQQQQRRGWLS